MAKMCSPPLRGKPAEAQEAVTQGRKRDVFKHVSIAVKSKAVTFLHGKPKHENTNSKGSEMPPLLELPLRPAAPQLPPLTFNESFKPAFEAAIPNNPEPSGVKSTQTDNETDHLKPSDPLNDNNEFCFDSDLDHEVEVESVPNTEEFTDEYLLGQYKPGSVHDSGHGSIDFAKSIIEIDTAANRTKEWVESVPAKTPAVSAEAVATLGDVRGNTQPKPVSNECLAYDTPGAKPTPSKKSNGGLAVFGGKPSLEMFSDVPAHIAFFDPPMKGPGGHPPTNFDSSSFEETVPSRYGNEHTHGGGCNAAPLYETGHELADVMDIDSSGPRGVDPVGNHTDAYNTNRFIEPTAGHGHAPRGSYHENVRAGQRVDSPQTAYYQNNVAACDIPVNSTEISPGAIIDAGRPEAAMPGHADIGYDGDSERSPSPGASNGGSHSGSSRSSGKRKRKEDDEDVIGVGQSRPKRRLLRANGRAKVFEKVGKQGGGWCGVGLHGDYQGEL